MDVQKFYDDLGLPFGSSLDEVKQVYKKLVKVWHPDLFVNAPAAQKLIAQEKITRINLAYKRLSSALAKSSNGQTLPFLKNSYSSIFKSGPKPRKESTPRNSPKSYKNTQSNPHQQDFSTQTILLPNGDRYEGQVLEDKMHGKGVYAFANGDIYDGDFYMDERLGKGFYQHDSGAWYEGQFKDGRPHGKGVYHFENGDCYTGQYEYGQPHGHGSYVTKAGKYLTGVWKNGQLI